MQDGSNTFHVDYCVCDRRPKDAQAKAASVSAAEDAPFAKIHSSKLAAKPKQVSSVEAAGLLLLLLPVAV